MEFPYPWLVEEQMAEFVKWIAALRELNELRDFDTTWKREDGRRIALSLNTTLLRNALGEPVAMLNIARDITDRKRLGLELERKNSQIELLNRIISKANETMDFGAMFAALATEVSNLVAYDQINVALVTEDGLRMRLHACLSPSGRGLAVGQEFPIEHTVSKLALAREKAVVIGHLTAHEELGAHTQPVAEGFESQISIPIHVHDRVLGTFNLASVARDAFTFQDLAYLEPIADQIGSMIDRTRLFQRVSDDSTYIHNLLNSINSVVYTIDENYRVTEVNKAWREFAVRTGLHQYRDEISLVGKTLWEIVPQDDVQAAFQRALPELFKRTKDVHSAEYQVTGEGTEWIYHVTVSPMVINNRVTGMVFTHTDITEIKRAEEEVRRRNKELLALNTISSSISKSLFLDEVLQVAAEQIKEIAGADAVMFYLKDERKDTLHLARSLGLDDHQMRRIAVLPTSQSLSGAVIAERKPMLIEMGGSSDIRITEAGREVFKSLGIESLAAIPLESKDKVLGAMNVAFVGEHHFEPQEQQLLALIGNQIGATIENAVLYQEVQEQVQRTTSLYTIGRGLTGALDAETILAIVHAEVVRAVPAERFTYRYFDEGTGVLLTMFDVQKETKHFSSSPADSPERVDASQSLFKNVVRGTPLLIGGGRDDAPGSVVAVPVRSKQRIIGVLAIHHSLPDVYTDTHLRLLESIANLTEIALDKALLYQDTINKSIEIENRNRDLDDFTYVVSHDLKEPLISIEGYSKILLKDYGDQLAAHSAEGREYLETVVQSSSRMKSLIDDLLMLSRVGRSAEAIEEVSVARVVSDLVRDLQFTLRERRVRIDLSPDLPTVLYNPTQLTMVFRNLITNAMKFNDKSEPLIRITAHDTEDEYVFAVEDNGIGIDNKYYDRIFMIFQRLQRSEEYRGTGAGLTIVKKIVENHRGRIWVESVPGVGTTFFFTVPRVPRA
jgi:PAS domain S-box-containing protein